MERDFDVVVAGDLNADLVLSGDVQPEFGQVEKLLDDATLTMGSSSAIFACGAARLGLRVAFIGKVGDDEFGRWLGRELETREIDTAGLVTDPQVKTGLTVILSKGHDRAMLTFPGSIAALRYGDIDQSIIQRARHLHMGSYFLLDGLRPDVPDLFAEAHRHGLTVSLDTNYDPSEKWDLAEVLPHVDIFLPNETELLRVAAQDDVSKALASLSQIVPLVVVKRGGQGAIARRGMENVSAEGLPVAVVDTTGAGDSFDAGLVYAHLKGWELPRMLRLACICGALSTRAAGGTDAQPTLAEALSFMDES